MTVPSKFIGSGDLVHTKIYRGTSSGGEVFHSTIANVTTYTDTNVTNGQTYYYTSIAINDAGDSSFSNEVNATPSASITTPTVPLNVHASVVEGNVKITWELPADNGGLPIKGYKIYRGTSAGGETYLATVGNVTTYMDRSVTGGQTYYYQISSFNDEGEGPRSSEVNATPSGSDEMLIIIITCIIIAAVIAVVTIVGIRIKRKSKSSHPRKAAKS